VKTLGFVDFLAKLSGWKQKRFFVIKNSFQMVVCATVFPILGRRKEGSFRG
jgi:hypothetical protein